MAEEKILIVEDEDDVLELIRYNLQKNGYRTDAATTGPIALSMAEAVKPDLILLDLMLPGFDGLEVCRNLKKDPKTSTIPIIMVTAKGTEADIVAGLEMGAADYIAKPFSPRVLLARIGAVLRRNRAAEAIDTSMLRIHDIEIDSGRHRVTVKNKPVDLTSTEFGLLRFLAARPGWVFTRYQIVDAIHGSDYPVTDRSIDVQIVGLRKKLGSAGKYIETVRGVGYRMQEDD
ncbi:MAG: response regulator transcription factor [Planctomycetes bacterium]|nr:response regulator transcription factor [Planctomycetota bacterium]